MRTAEEILNEVMNTHTFRSIYGDSLTNMILPAINEARKEAIIEAANVAKDTMVNIKPILKLIDELK